VFIWWGVLVVLFPHFISTKKNKKIKGCKMVKDLQNGMVLGVIGALALMLSEKYIGVQA
jgi:hypothetical protein